MDLTNKKIWRNYGFLASIYFFAHAWIFLIPNAVFWDDWVLVNTVSDDLLALFNRAGSMFNIGGYGHVYLQGGWLGWYKVGVFLFFLGAGLVLDKVLERSNILSERWRIYAVALFLVLPLNPARVAQINFFYAACYFSFFLAWLFMDQRKFISAILFYFSFNTNSLLVFFIVPFFDYFYRHGFLSKKEILNNFRCLLPFIALPFLYYFVKTVFYTPFGEYASYNSGFSFANVRISLVGQVKDFLMFVFDWPLLLTFIALLVGGIGFSKGNLFELTSIRTALKLGLLGFFLTVLACFPYWVVGHVPTVNEWTSRHQLLMPLGLALLIVSVCMVFRDFFGKLLFYWILMVSVAMWIHHYRNFYYDWKKQERLVQLFLENKKLKDAGLVVFQDETMRWNAIGRAYRFYEWNGLMALSFGDESRFGVSKSELSIYCKGGYDKYFILHNKAKDHLRGNECIPVVVRIIEKNENPSVFQFFDKNVLNISIEVL